jgi:hypothetical protein
VSGLSFVDTRANADDDAGRAGRDKMIELVRQGHLRNRRADAPKMLDPQRAQDAPVMVARLKGIMLETPRQTVEAACVAMRERADFTPHLATLPCPLQVIVASPMRSRRQACESMHHAAPAGPARRDLRGRPPRALRAGGRGGARP